MATLTEPTLKTATYNFSGRVSKFYDYNEFTASESRKFQQYAREVGKRVAKEPNFTLAISCIEGVGCLSFRENYHISCQIPDKNSHGWPFKDSPDISEIKVPSCIRSIMGRIVGGEKPTLYLAYTNPVSLQEKD